MASKFFDFPPREYEYFLKHCHFTTEDKELDVFKMKREKFSNVQISMTLNLSESTIKLRVKSIKEKIIFEISRM